MPGQNAVLELPDGRRIELPVLRPSYGNELLVDIRTLHANGIFTYDPGFTSTASCCSAITYIDGNAGVCLYRGYPVVELCERFSYLDVCYLLYMGELPTPEVSVIWQRSVFKEAMLHEAFKQFMNGFTYDAHPMAILVSTLGALASYANDWSIADAGARELASVRLIAKMPVLAAMCYKKGIGEPYVNPRMDHSYAGNFLRMMFATPLEEYVVDPVHEKAINMFLILHADHEQNASTSTVRTAGSSQANAYACIAAGCASLWGPAHGGANEACIKMLEEIGTVDKVEAFVNDVKNKKAGVRLMGFGHRVYKNYDPRATAMKKLTMEVIAKLGKPSEKLEIAKRLEEVALSDEYFIKRKLYPNVDFYSGIMLQAIGVPLSMYTVLFAMARSVGWITQWNEMIESSQMRISRPRQLYDGPVLRHVETELSKPKERKNSFDQLATGSGAASLLLQGSRQMVRGQSIINHPSLSVPKAE